MKKKNRISKRELWNKLRFKYKLSFLNEKTLEEAFSIRLSWLSFIILVTVFATFLIVLTSVVIIKTPIRNYLPGYLDSEIRQSMIENALRTDSLEQMLSIQSRYMNNVSAILRGDIKVDEIVPPDSLSEVNDSDLAKTPRLEEFIRNYEEDEKFNLGTLTGQNNIPDNITFYKPTRGIISSGFDEQKRHYGIDIAAIPKEPVLATLKGTIIFTGFDANAGYITQIQHPNGFISVYKHNALLLKKPGDEVEAGEAIALVGNTGNYSTGDHLHFELWYRGRAVNPQEYINF